MRISTPDAIVRKLRSHRRPIALQREIGLTELDPNSRSSETSPAHRRRGLLERILPEVALTRLTRLRTNPSWTLCKFPASSESASVRGPAVPIVQSSFGCLGSLAQIEPATAMNSTLQSSDVHDGRSLVFPGFADVFTALASGAGNTAMATSQDTGFADLGRPVRRGFKKPAAATRKVKNAQAR